MKKLTNDEEGMSVVGAVEHLYYRVEKTDKFIRSFALCSIIIWLVWITLALRQMGVGEYINNFLAR